MNTKNKNEPVKRPKFRLDQLRRLLNAEKRESKSIQSDIEKAKADNVEMERHGKGNKKAAYKAVIQKDYPGEWTDKEDADFDEEYDDYVNHLWNDALEQLEKDKRMAKITHSKGGKRRLFKTKRRYRSTKRNTKCLQRIARNANKASRRSNRRSRSGLRRSRTRTSRRY